MGWFSGVSDEIWGGLDRDCPRCGRRFRSRFDKGACPQCYHIFNASEEYPDPPGTDRPALLARAMARRKIISPAQSQAILDGGYTELTLVTELDLPDLVTGKSQYVLESFEVEREWFREEMDAGGTLYHWDHTDLHSRFAGYFVVREGRVTAWVRNVVFLSDPAPLPREEQKGFDPTVA